MVIKVNGKFDIDFEVSGVAGREPRIWSMIKENGELKVEKTAGGTVDIRRWRILPSAVSDFLALPEETEICHLSDPVTGAEKTYHKYDIYKVIVASEFAEIPCLSGACLCRPKVEGEPAKFNLSLGLISARDRRQPFVEAMYPDTFQRALFKIGALLEPDDNGFVPKYFVGCQSGRLYNISLKGVGLSATVLEDDLDIQKVGRLDGLKVIDGIGGRGNLPLDALEGTDYLANAIDDVNGLVHLAFVDKNLDLVRSVEAILTKDEQTVVVEVYH